MHRPGRIGPKRGINVAQQAFTRSSPVFLDFYARFHPVVQDQIANCKKKMVVRNIQ